jgi:hypothetical protein
MAWKIEYWKKEHIISAKISGPINLDTLKRFASEIIVALSIHNVTKVLTDYRDVTLDVSILDIYELPKILKKLGYSPRIQIAVVYSEASEQKESFLFYENALRYDGFFHRVFTDLLESLAWLKSNG